MRASIARIEAAIDAGLGESVNDWPELRIDEQTQTRIKKGVAVGEDEAGSGAAELVSLEIERAAEPGADIAVRRGER